MANDTTPLVPAPDLLRPLARWIPWDWHTAEGGRTTKRPRVSTLDRDRWETYARVASRTAPPRCAGYGFVMTGGVAIPDRGWVCGLDIDACRDPATGLIASWSRRILEAMPPTYTEITVSGTGLRPFYLLPDKPPPMGRIRVEAQPIAGVDKRPEVEIFGSGGGQYVAMSFQQLEGTPDHMAFAPSLDPVFALLGVTSLPVRTAAMPAGEGAPPAIDAVLDALRCVPRGPDLIAGNWRVLQLPSASEAWWQLVQHALRAARGHGQVVAEMLLLRTPWGQGLIDSREPDRYRRRDWVEADVARIGSKAPTPSAANVFTPVPTTPVAETPTASEPPSRVLPFSEFRNLVASVEWLVYGVLPQQGLAQLFGAPGSGKTPVAVSLALHVACGSLNLWHGHDIDTHGPVVYMVGEDAAGLRDRIEAQARVLAIDPNGIYVTTMPGRLTDPADREAWVRDIRRAVGADHVAMVVIDTLSRNFGPGDENSTQDMGQFVAQVDALSRSLRCIALLVHHPGHGTSDRARGSSVLPGALDASYEVTREGTVVEVTCRKMKNAAEPAVIRGELAPVAVGTDRQGRAITAITIMPQAMAPDIEATRRLFREAPLMIALLKALESRRGEIVSVRALQDALQVGRKAARGLVEDAMQRGLVEEHEVSPGNPRQGRTYSITEVGVALLVTEVIGL